MLVVQESGTRWSIMRSGEDGDDDDSGDDNNNSNDRGRRLTAEPCPCNSCEAYLECALTKQSCWATLQGLSEETSSLGCAMERVLLSWG